jgi:hypothetical protein
MLSRLVGTIAVGVLIVAGVAEYASAFDQPIFTKSSLIKPGKLYKIVSKPTSGEFPIPPAEGGDGTPIDLGGSVAVTLNNGTLNCTLASQSFLGSGRTEGWIGRGRPPGSTGWKYLNNMAPVGGMAGACKMVLITGGVIKVLAKGTGGLVVTGSSGDVSLGLAAGDAAYCALAKPPHSKEITGKLLKMKGQPAPESCPGPTTTTTTIMEPTTTSTATTTTTTTTFGFCNYTWPQCWGWCSLPDQVCADFGTYCACISP